MAESPLRETLADSRYPLRETLAELSDSQQSLPQGTLRLLPEDHFVDEKPRPFVFRFWLIRRMPLR